jgi:6-hydroxytryprostatin B O-methyltransferase
VPSGTTISLPDLAAATGLDEDVLTRTVRYAITNGIFSEPEPGQIAHTATSATLAKNKNLHDMTVFNSGFSTRIVVSLADTLKAQQEKQPTAPEEAFNLSYPGYVNLFDYMGKHPDASQGYFNYLDGRSQLPRYAVGNVVQSWDWASVGSGTIVDVCMRFLSCQMQTMSNIKLTD